MQKSILRLDYCKKIPKIELHAHLHGCVRKSTLRELLTAQNLVLDEDVFKEKNMKGAFRIFDYIHKSITKLDHVKRILNEMLDDFESENCMYLELRSTPRKFPETTTDDYVKMIITELEKREASKSNPMKVRCLLSMNRGEPLEKAKETLELAKKYKSTGYIVGLDYSGNPYEKSFRDFRDFYQEGRDNGLKIAVHAGELPDETTARELDDVLDFKPDRIGHFNYFTEKQFNRLLEDKIPVETCPTSNKYTMELGSYEDHHFVKWFEKKHPICVCTDDTIVFDTDLSEEIHRISSAFGLGEADVHDVVYRSVDGIFEDKLREGFKQRVKEFSF